MDPTVNDLLYEIALKMGKSQKDIDPIVNKLKKNWIEKASQMQLISHKDWQDLQIPMGFKHQIIIKLEELKQKTMKMNINLDNQLKNPEMFVKTPGFQVELIRHNNQNTNSTSIQNISHNDVYLIKAIKDGRIFSNQMFEKGIHKITVRISEGTTNLKVGLLRHYLPDDDDDDD